ncbi:SDR family NAD(P)-dependent oxidoreductase [Rhodoligotrophos defluvii]|uniref:SDR family NAD(P)-dependent oxidoreductase n=1 Tax=Rhodoligotrophos defluvii TaxID=2561934 RepID=UPI0010C95FD4|nr:SDR family NAD(P)-dependent oxidoreductase [Rhodoligotrophos defluvii]
MTNLLKDRIALVTGASRGIGYATAKALAAEGAHIIALARTVGGLEELDDEIKALGGAATLVPVDLRDFDALDRLGVSIYERWGKLDILIGNAGVLGRLTPVGHIKPKEWDEAFAVNVTANWRLIRSLDVLLRQSDAGRALFITSGAARNARAYWGLYSTTKAALETLVLTYAKEVAITPVRVNLLNPGATRTAMRAKAMPGEDPASLPAPADIAAQIPPLVAPALTDNGAIWDIREGRLVRR